MLKDITWFTSRIGKDILRGTTTITIKDEAMAHKLHDLQDDSYFFTDTSSTSDLPLTINDDSWLNAAKPQVRIHRVLQECEACSA